MNALTLQYILYFSCDGDYTLEQCEHQNSHKAFSSYVCICGLKDFQIAYVTQAARGENDTGVTIYLKENVTKYASAHILHKNYYHTEEKLYVAFDGQGDKDFNEHFMPLLINGFVNIRVDFNLKDSYFINLLKCISNLPSDVVPRILSYDFHHFSHDMSTFNMEEIKHQTEGLDTEQKSALRMILVQQQENSPPILISGPFGTGKTRILAVAAHILLQKPSSCILVCTQQRKSADNFLLMYHDVVRRSRCKDDHVKKVLLISGSVYGGKDPRLKHFYCEPSDLPGLALSHSSGNFLFVTTCLSAHHLTKVKVTFSHIFIDEGAQMREPEAIAALRKAKSDTKIVIAGDPQQVILHDITVD